MSSQDLLGSESPSEPIGATPVEFSAASGSIDSSQSPVAGRSCPPVAASAKGPFSCSVCKKVLKTVGGYAGHVARHRVTEAQNRRPDIMMVASEVPLIIEDIFKAVADEPFGVQKKLFVVELLQKTQEENEDWVEFCLDLAEPILLLVCEKSKLLPQNQYEEIHKHLNVFLNKSDNMNSLLAKLRSVCAVELPEHVGRRLVFRVALMLLDKLQVLVAQKMRNEESQAQPPSQSQEVCMSATELKAFTVKVGDFIRCRVQKNSNSNSSSLQRQNSCIRDSFIVTDGLISSESFLNKELWYAGHEESIEVSDCAVKYFQTVDSIFRRLTTDQKLPGCDEIVEQLYKEPEALQTWFQLTSNYFGEDDGVVFLKNLTASFIRLVLYKVNEERTSRMVEKDSRATEASLRTHLHTNFSGN